MKSAHPKVLKFKTRVLSSLVFCTQIGHVTDLQIEWYSYILAQ